MKCSLCGTEFDEARAAGSCPGCALGQKCALARCPNCGFEMVREPDWVRRLGAWWRKIRKVRQ